MELTDKQYELMLEIYNQWDSLFDRLPMDIKIAFYTRLYS